MSLIGGGHKFMTSMSRSSKHNFFEQKFIETHQIYLKVMTLCSNWHSWVVKG